MTEQSPTPAIAAIGLGHWGRNLARNLSALGVLRAMYDADAATRARFAETYPEARAAERLDDVLGDPGIDGIMIASPAATHGEMVRRALDAGKHVFVEKPLCLDVAEANALKRQADHARRVLMVGHLLRYHPAFTALLDAVRAGRLGRLRYIYSNRLSLGKIRREENALWSFAPHDISMILALAGDRLPKQVSATGANYLTDHVADTTLSHMAFDSGLQAHVYVSWLHPYKDQRLVVIGDAGMAVFNDVAAGAEKLLFYPHKAGWDGEVPLVDKAEAEAIPYEEAEPLRRECQAFLDAIAGRAAPPSDAAEGIRVLSVLDACQRSILTGAKVTL